MTEETQVSVWNVFILTCLLDIWIEMLRRQFYYTSLDFRRS